ncbi:putative restriction endonuclease [Actinomadura pelletieri DSM 43383]|uniref:Putative restriction endonuclease n=1 Tax=Actinomadura pelletieri DSM 43383 TaxID=1120940 RepID=A0A495QUL0_9ACTN|nr:HNH endonuclease [Actinomadura pelletieri]RKS77138.1 putative restriction endonuclease [Actinomadura pelletieri DSM 43383]
MEWVERVLKVRRHSHDGVRAPHKPLLLLYALGRFRHEGPRAIEFSAAEDDLRRLLAEFGPPRKTSPGYPFHHLTNDDGLWEVRTADGGPSPGSAVGALRSRGAAGRLHPELAAALADDSALLPRLVRALLETYFAPSLHADICQMVGLELEDAELPTDVQEELGRRDPAFRLEVLEAYEFCCAFCGYEGWLNGAAVGLDAAHVRWRTYGGPDRLDNGICLCALHHRLFDRGVVGLTGDRLITVSRKYVGRTAASENLVLELVGRPARDPQPGLLPVGSTHIDWHARQVFRGPARAA